jgi:molybdopterin converting factor subunit 1
VEVLLFAAFREAVGCSRLQIETPSGTTVEGLFSLLQSKHPGLAPLRPFTTFAVNREVVPPDALLQPGDEVAFLQPVSGGAA